MARELVAPLAHLVKTQAAGSLPAPASAIDGVDITDWRSGGFGPTRAAIMLYGTAATVSDVWLWGYRRGRWHRLGKLFGGESRVIASAIVGAADAADIIGIFDRLAASGTDAVSISAEFEPLEVQG
jgi:hypothetical protein